MSRVDLTLVTIVPPSGYAEEMSAAAEAPLLPLLRPLLPLQPASAPGAEALLRPRVLLRPRGAPAAGAAPAAGGAAAGGAAPKK